MNGECPKEVFVPEVRNNLLVSRGPGSAGSPLLAFMTHILYKAPGHKLKIDELRNRLASKRAWAAFLREYEFGPSARLPGKVKQATIERYRLRFNQIAEQVWVYEEDRFSLRIDRRGLWYRLSVSYNDAEYETAQSVRSDSLSLPEVSSYQQAINDRDCYWVIRWNAMVNDVQLAYHKKSIFWERYDSFAPQYVKEALQEWGKDNPREYRRLVTTESWFQQVRLEQVIYNHITHKWDIHLSPLKYWLLLRICGECLTVYS